MALVFIYTTVGSQKDAQKLAEILVKQQFAACVSVWACVQSHYVWQGVSEWAEEYPLTIKQPLKINKLCAILSVIITPIRCLKLCACPFCMRTKNINNG